MKGIIPDNKHATLNPKIYWFDRIIELSGDETYAKARFHKLLPKTVHWYLEATAVENIFQVKHHVSIIC